MRLGHSLGLNRTVSILAVTLTGAATLLAGEDEGFALDFTDDSAVVRDTGTPANDYSGAASLGLLTYTSPSTKMVLGADGTLKRANHNLLTYSQAFDNAAWTKNNSTCNANAAVAPDGTTTADELVGNATISGHQFYQGVSVVAGRKYTLSCFVKDVNCGYIGIDLGAGGFPGTAADRNAYFDIQNGTATQIQSAVEDYSITAVGDGWYRISVTQTADASANSFVQIQLFNGTTPNFDATGLSVYVWGAQIKALPVHDAGTLADYIATTSAARYRLPIEYDTSGNALGLLVEEQRTNLLTYSQDFTNAAWTKTNTATLAADATGPDGATSAVTLVDSGAGGTGQVFAQQPVNVSTSTSYVFSVYAKAGALSWLVLNTNNFTTPSNGNTAFNLSAGTVGTTHTDHTASIVSVGNGWYRCSIKFTTDAADTTGNLRVAVSDADLATNATYVVDLDGTSSILIYGAQLEAGSFPTSYIPTTSAQVTRAADQVSIATSALPWDQSVSTFVAAGIKRSSGTARSMIDVTVGQRPLVASNQAALFATGGNTANVSLSEPSIDTAFKNALAFALNDFAAVQDGGAVSTDATVDVGGAAGVDLRIGRDIGASNFFNGHIRQITYLPRRASNAELQSLTA